MLVWPFYWQLYSPPREKTPGLLLTNIPPPPSLTILPPQHTFCRTDLLTRTAFISTFYILNLLHNTHYYDYNDSQYGMWTADIWRKFSCLEWRFIKYFSTLSTSKRERNFICIQYLKIFNPRAPSSKIWKSFSSLVTPKVIKYFLFF